MVFKLTIYTGIGVITGISGIAAMITICGIGWVLGSQLSNLDGKLESLGLPDPKKFQDCVERYNTSICTMYTEQLVEIEMLWSKTLPILITCCAISILVGFGQLTTSLAASFSGSKDSRKRTRIWMISHFVFALILINCILSAYFTRSSYGVDMMSWSALVDDLKNTVKAMEPEINFGPLSTFLTIPAPLFYGVVSTDIVLMAILFIAGILVLQKYIDYEAQE